MAKYVGTRIIEAPVERVFDYRLNIYNLPDYNPKVSDVDVISEEHPNQGKTYCFRLRMGPGLYTQVTLAVLNAERPRRLVFRIRALMDAREECFFEPLDIDGRAITRIRFEYTVYTRGGPFAPLVDALFVKPNMRRLVEDELDLIKARLEGPETG